MQVFIGIDSGSVSTKAACCDLKGNLLTFSYLPTGGQPLLAAQEALQAVKKDLPSRATIIAICLTGSARKLLAASLQTDIIKNEITAQAMAAVKFMPDVATVLEIGGQDSKIILIENGLPIDFAMNTVCAAGTGSFLDHQAARLGINIEEFAVLAAKSQKAVDIDARCTVFAESAMISAQQNGVAKEDIAYGLAQALAANFLNNVGAGKTLKDPYVFQGGVACNQAIVQALQQNLNEKISVPPYPHISGAYGAALCALKESK